MELYLKPTKAIDSDNEAIIKKAKELTSHSHSDRDKAVALFYFVRDSIYYNPYMISTFFEDFIASTTLARGKGYCVQKAVLLAALARAAGIPSRLVFAKIKNHRLPQEFFAKTGINVLLSHGYTQLYLNEKWVNVSPTFNKELCENIGVPVVEFDGINDAMHPPYDLSGNPYIEYIEKYEPQADLPFEWIRNRVLPVWGEKRSWSTSEDSKGHRMPSGYIFE